MGGIISIEIRTRQETLGASFKMFFDFVCLRAFCFLRIIHQRNGNVSIVATAAIVRFSEITRVRMRCQARCIWHLWTVFLSWSNIQSCFSFWRTFSIRRGTEFHCFSSRSSYDTGFGWCHSPLRLPLGTGRDHRTFIGVGGFFSLTRFIVSFLTTRTLPFCNMWIFVHFNLDTAFLSHC